MSERQDTQVLKSVSSEPAQLDDLEAACLEMQNAAQWLARVTRSYAAAPDDALRLPFDPDTRRLSTPDIGQEIRLELTLPGLVFQFVEDGAPTPHALDVDDRSSTEVEAWLLAELLH